MTDPNATPQRAPDDGGKSEQALDSTTERPSPSHMSPVDRQLDESPLTPNELDQTDEARKAADITRAGSRTTRGVPPAAGSPGESPQSPASCAPDGKSADRYAG